MWKRGRACRYTATGPSDRQAQVTAFCVLSLGPVAHVTGRKMDPVDLKPVKLCLPALFGTGHSLQ